MKLFKTERLPGGVVKEFYSEPSGKITIATRQETDRVIQGVRDYAELSKTKDMKYRGSVPMSVAAKWSVECGHAVGTRGFSEYAAKKLKSGDYGYLRAGVWT